MTFRRQLRRPKIATFALLALVCENARADIDSNGILDKVLDQYSTAAEGWSTVITTHASWLFWTLALISMVWTFGMMALRKADIGEFFAEFARFTIFTGFFWWLLANGPSFATSIINSLRQIGGQATGSGPGVTPSGIVDVGFGIFLKVVEQSTVWQPVDFALGVIIAAIVLVVFALVSVNMLVLLISGWILAYAGVFFLGFGGARWTSDIAINYFKTVLSLAAQLFTMVLLVGIGSSFVDLYYTNMNSKIRLTEMAVMLVVAIVLLSLVNKVPSLVGNLAMGGGTGSLGNGFGPGAILGAAAIAGAATATAGASLAAGLANVAGGTQALMAAFSKANGTASAGGGSAGFMETSGSSSTAAGDSSGNALADAMGDGQSSVGAAGERNPAFATPMGNESQSSSKDTGSTGGQDNQSDRGNTAAQASEGLGEARSERRDAKGVAAGGTDKGKPSFGRSAAKAAASVGILTAGTAANLAKGSWDVAKESVGKLKETAMSRVAETPGGKIAAAINARNLAANLSDSTSSGGGNSLSAGKSDNADASAEVAAFRDSKHP